MGEDLLASELRFFVSVPQLKELWVRFLQTEEIQSRSCFIRNDTIGRGARDSISQKVLEIALVWPVPVLIIDQLRKSKAYCNCSRRLKQERSSCLIKQGICKCISVLDRDIKASVNMASFGTLQMLGKPRLLALQRMNRSDTESPTDLNSWQLAEAAPEVVTPKEQECYLYYVF